MITLKFSDSKIPEFKEVIGQDYIKFGEDDKYPEYLLSLYNKSAKHNAIINGKVNYIFGGGFEIDIQDPKAEEFKTKLGKIDKQSLTDIEVFGGFYWEIIPSPYGEFGIYHVGFKNIKTNADRTKFFYKKDWSDWKEERKAYPAYNRNLDIPSIFSFKEYRPGGGVYALPGYVASCNYIEADVEVSKHTLTNSKTGFSASKFINFYNGVPANEEKREIVSRFKAVNTGSEGEKVIIAFNNPTTQPPTIEDLGQSDISKEDFTQIDNLITNNIFSGAQITHPLLFGIQQEGKLGGATELRTAFDIFKNTYVTGKQKQFEEIVNFFAGLKGITAKYKLIDIDPIGFEFTEATMLAVAPRSWLLEKMGIDPKLYPDAPASGIVPPVQQEGMSASGTNDNIKNLTGRQYQQVTRLIKQFNDGKITKQAVSLLLKTGYGLTPEDIGELLGIDQSQVFSTDEDMNLLFAAHGEDASSYEVINSKAATFDAEDDDFIASQNFDDFQPTPEVQEQINRPPTASLRPPIKIKVPKFEIRYSYEVRSGEGAEILPTTRPFCAKMVSMSKFYSRQDIQKISQILGYNVFERVGGFWNDNGTIKKHCRHEWKANIVVRK